MILRQFPGTRGNAEVFSYFSRQNVIVYAGADNISYAEHTAPLSIKSTLQGREVYELSGIPIAVEPGSWLVLNDEQPYASYICSESEVASFCVFFRSGLVGEALDACASSTEQLLDDPLSQREPTVEFCQHLHRDDQIVAPLLARLHTGITAGLASQLWIDEECHRLMAGLLRVEQKVREEIAQLPAVRHATRVELFRRLHRAKDYLEACYDQPLTIARLAQVACLSPHHFLRLFTRAFRLTPHQYLTSVRLQKALALLRETDLPVIEICLSVGFEDGSSFARLVKRHFQLSPQQLRRQRG